MEATSFRLNKYIAHCGVCSRRKAAELVKGGMVKVNGKTETNPAYVVQPSDKVEYGGKILEVEEKKIYLLMNKPKNVVTTVSDERGRRTVIDLLRNKVKERVYPVGRLDKNTTGLLLLTNDGELAKKLAHPSHQVKKFYQVRLDREVSEADLEHILKGVKLDDGIAEVDSAGYVKDRRNEIGLELHSGRNRIIRRIFEALDYEVIKLDRVYYAGLTKKDLPRGWFRHLTEREIIMLKHFT
jgi:23S rRNA pseudouridine2605 synthase